MGRILRMPQFHSLLNLNRYKLTDTLLRDTPQQHYDRYVCFKDSASSHAHRPCRCHISSHDTNHTHEPHQHIHYHRHYHTEPPSPTSAPLCAVRRIHTHHDPSRRSHRSQYQCPRCCSGCDSSWVCERCRGLNRRTAYGPSVPVVMTVPRGCMGR
ncbi:hypothetical protein ASPWEDRAFT_547309 [Aspergillus wentii DTO 134E9]|uniref:Uncharacterized protein n=1 Tax=Aspergillus wentii DTO 134E9 TaxID=1073089 RepID=A0A1L9RG07_ASPWE|nr:uncharacterized protein ASPWEDRAFT_547309 [Aspergillus wentii DTO 134E9]OJJ33862.1 hypothetical protein ASPWEDRAFT_547309 [Aspergillus wentii DTO 134E9]